MFERCFTFQHHEHQLLHKKFNISTHLYSKVNPAVLQLSQFVILMLRKASRAARGKWAGTTNVDMGLNLRKEGGQGGPSEFELELIAL